MKKYTIQSSRRQPNEQDDAQHTQERVNLGQKRATR